MKNKTRRKSGKPRGSAIQSPSPMIGHARPRRRKIGRRILLGAMMIGAVLFAFQRAYSVATHMALFRLKEVTISGNHVVPADRIRSLAQIEPGQNLFSVALTEAAARIQAEPMVKTVRLSRKLPDRIAISITEREPIALLARERLYGVDSEGILLPPFPPERMPDLPIFTSIGADTTKPGGVIQSLRLWEGIRFVNEMRAREPGLIAVISEIGLGSREGLMLYLIDGGMKVKWGRGAFERKIGPFRAALSQIPSKHRLPRYLDVRFEGQVVARF